MSKTYMMYVNYLAQYLTHGGYLYASYKRLSFIRKDGISYIEVSWKFYFPIQIL